MSPDRAAVEAALPPRLRAALVELCELLGVRRDGWHRTPLEPMFTAAAAVALAARIRAESGLSLARAADRAASLLGLTRDQVRYRLSKLEDSTRVAS